MSARKVTRVSARLKLETPELGMNKTETRFAQTLELLKKAGKIHWWGFEAMSFKISTKTRYTPDFTIVESDGRMTHYETKATWRDKKTKKPKLGWHEASRVRFHTAATMYPFFEWRAVRPGLRPLGEIEWVEYNPAARS